MKRIVFLLLLAGVGFADSNLDNAIGWLKSVQDQDTGEINHYGVWGTAWGTIALSLYGENESTLNRSLAYIANSQNNDGGIPYELGSPWGSGVDYSAPAILAFVSSNRAPNLIEKNNKTPMDFIWGTQGANGGFGEWGEDVVSTSLAVMALGTTGENVTKTGKDPAAFILSKQNSTDGGFEWWTKSEATAQALLALNIMGVNNSNTTAGLSYLKSIQNTTTGGIVDPYVTAFSAIAFKAYGWDREHDLATGYLRSVQNESGRIDRTDATQASDAFTTALSALAFMNFSFKSMDADVSCEGNVLSDSEIQTCNITSGLPLSKFLLNDQAYYSTSTGKTFGALPAGEYTLQASAFGAKDHAFYHTPVKTISFSVYGIVSPQKDQSYNLGDTVQIFITNTEDTSAYLNGDLLNGSTSNRTYRYNFTANQTGNFTLTFIISNITGERNFTVSDRYTVQITNPGSCTIGAPSQIAFSVLGANGNAVSNATVFACFNGNCAQTDNSSYPYTCAASNSFYVNASKGGNFGYGQIEFSGANPTSGGSGGDYVTVEVEFPPNAGRHDISRVLNFGECEYAYDCFAKVVSMDCSWFSAGAALACPGSAVSQTCLATGVDGIKASSNGWWSFYTNGALSAWGISCYKVNSGDRIKFKYSGDYKAESPPPEAPPANSGTGLAIAAVIVQKNTSITPKETPSKPIFMEKAGFKIEESIGKGMLPSLKALKIVSGARAPCATCDFASALLLKSELDALNISSEITTDDSVRECPRTGSVIFVGGPVANRGVSADYLNITGSADGGIYNMSANCFVVAGNTRNLTNRAVAALIETFK